MAESTGHVLWGCVKAQEAWSCSKLVGLVDRFDCCSFMDLLWKMVILDRVEEDKVARMVTIAWALWFHQNEVRLSGVRKAGKDVVRWATQYLEEYWAANECGRSAPVVVERTGSWLPPQANWFKINVDGDVFASQKAVGLGVIIRDDRGRVEAAMSKKVLDLLGALETEAKAFEAGLLLARDIGIQDVILEGDSLVIYNALCEVSLPPSLVTSIVDGMRDLCKVFRRLEFSHVKRKGNRPAHLLAKYAGGIDDFIVWMEENPYFLEQALPHDVLS
ncbi:uncharacterized protein LOC126696240 [Quercus robur]|uniref:uncharacterized protein LOC126696240 n=1 Tax=Quercus robur TaxID=38942 RepID=UPI0021628E48|nr:uncharacterized protein LOC126696240 [Quercus robur]